MAISETRGQGGLAALRAWNWGAMDRRWPGDLTGNWGRWTSPGEMDKPSTCHGLTEVARTTQTAAAHAAHTALVNATCSRARWRCKGLTENRSLGRLGGKKKPVHLNALPSSASDLSAESGGLIGSRHFSYNIYLITESLWGTPETNTIL